MILNRYSIPNLNNPFVKWKFTTKRKSANSWIPICKIKNCDHLLNNDIDIKKIISKFKIPIINEDRYTKRLDIELKLFIEKDLLKYLYFAIDILELTKDIPHITRGSCGSSLLCYYLGISHVDPVKYDIKFERFLR